VLGPPVLALIYLGGDVFHLFAGLLSVLLLNEWRRLVDLTGITWMAVGLGLGAVLGGAAWIAGTGRYEAALLMVAVAALAAAFLKIEGARRRWLAAGVVYVGLPVLALIWLRSQPLGLEWTFWLMLVVWATDIGAFVFGRAIGGFRLAPRISPNKTWAGLFGGMFSAFVISVLVAVIAGVRLPQDLVAIGAAGAVLAVVEQIGDLVESGVKRHFGVKDSGRLLPGHGGLLDRLDGLLFAAPALALMLMVTGGLFAEGL
jgi:phosphatidate cytidylyltransferase